MGFGITDIFVLNENCTHNEQVPTKICIFTLYVLTLFAVVGTKIYVKQKHIKLRDSDDHTRKKTKISEFILLGFKDDQIEELYRIKTPKKELSTTVVVF